MLLEAAGTFFYAFIFFYLMLEKKIHKRVNVVGVSAVFTGINYYLL